MIRPWFHLDSRWNPAGGGEVILVCKIMRPMQALSTVKPLSKVNITVILFGIISFRSKLFRAEMIFPQRISNNNNAEDKLSYLHEYFSYWIKTMVIKKDIYQHWVLHLDIAKLYHIVSYQNLWVSNFQEMCQSINWY